MERAAASASLQRAAWNESRDCIAFLHAESISVDPHQVPLLSHTQILVQFGTLHTTVYIMSAALRNPLIAITTTHTAGNHCSLVVFILLNILLIFVLALDLALLVLAIEFAMLKSSAP